MSDKGEQTTRISGCKTITISNTPPQPSGGEGVLELPKHDVFPKRILDDVLVLLAGQQFPTPEKGFTGWEDALASLKRFVRERATQPATAPSDDKLPSFRTTKEAMEYAARHKLPAVIPVTTPTDVAERARRAADKIDASLVSLKEYSYSPGISAMADIIAAEFTEPRK